MKPYSPWTSLITSLLIPQARDHAASPFVDEDTFVRFTEDMVKQYIQEEEVRSKHETALLRLREKALIEKTKADMAWLELQKKSLRDKGADDLMPPLKKKQRGLWMKLQAEQVLYATRFFSNRVAKPREKNRIFNPHGVANPIRSPSNWICEFLKAP